MSQARLVIADTERPEYRVRGAAGALERIVRWTPGAPFRVTEEEIERFRASAIERAPPTFRARLQRAYDAMPFPRTKTPFNNIHLDADGCVWATAWPDPESGRQTAAVFAADGRALGALDLPRRVSIHEIGVDYLLAGATDDLGVESVRLYRLERTHGCRPS